MAYAINRLGALVASFPVAICCLSIGGCQRDDEQTSMYALVPSSKSTSRFDQDLAALAKQHGLTPRLGHATDDKGHTLNVVEAKGRWIRLWAQNAPERQ